MRRADLILGLVVTAVGAYALVLALNLAMFSSEGEPGPGFFPRFISGLLLGLGVLLAVLSLRRAPKRKRQPAAQAQEAAGPPAASPPQEHLAPSQDGAGTSPVALRSPQTAQVTDTAASPQTALSARRQLRAGTVWLCYAVTMPLLALLGFVPAAAALVFVLLFGVEGRRNWRAVLVAIAVPVAASFIFTKLLSVPLPEGLLSHGPLGI